MNGLPQGSILAPLLFTIYINNFVPPLQDTHIHYYADDTVLYSTGPTHAIAAQNLQAAFNVFQLSVFSHKLVLNAKKTKCMFFSLSDITSSSSGIFTLQNEEIELVNSYKYLGIWLDSKLSFQTHVDCLVKSLRSKIGFLFRNKACFSTRSRKTIVQSLVMPVFDYGDTLYMHASQTVLKPLDAVFHSALRFITGYGFRTHHCDLYTQVNWPSLANRREQHILLLIFKALSGKVPLCHPC